MFNAESYVSALTSRLMETFGERLSYVGLQGSYLRGEAHEGSDIDIMVVIEGMTVRDMDQYRSIIQSLENPDKSCGFICSREDLANWNPLESFHVLNSTRDIHGVLSELLPHHTREDIINFAKFSLNNLYHELCHRYIHAGPEKSAAKLPFTLKGVFYILQSVHYLRTGTFIPTKKELLEQLSGLDRHVLELSLSLNDSAQYDFDASFESVFNWCRETLASLR